MPRKSQGFLRKVHPLRVNRGLRSCLKALPMDNSEYSRTTPLLSRGTEEARLTKRWLLRSRTASRFSGCGLLAPGEKDPMKLHRSLDWLWPFYHLWKAKKASPPGARAINEIPLKG
ncbi:hypothetical protein HAX54_024865 [Datura stramonium]|uniref:Uncharacterized protein n=1 Tax=Datura stramonium TaxID=4076 RepID=A0ABS8UYK6_DATST|nr:hypothetical protein [Datura stramonium]